ncbi:MAG: hypothetical protein PHY16_01090 [Methylobacter sp.]|nr:hypothetical protein [Methylobacter sp.]
MKSLLIAMCLTMMLAGGVAEPAVISPVPVGVTYIAPTYARPGPGYVWQHHPQYGWGWHHPNLGWHRGWR